MQKLHSVQNWFQIKSQNAVCIEKVKTGKISKTPEKLFAFLSELLGVWDEVLGVLDEGRSGVAAQLPGPGGVDGLQARLVVRLQGHLELGVHGNAQLPAPLLPLPLLLRHRTLRLLKGLYLRLDFFFLVLFLLGFLFLLDLFLALLFLLL